MSDYIGFIANCPIRGIEFTTIQKDGVPWKIRNLVRLTVNGFSVELHQDPSLPANLFSLKDGFVHTTEARVPDIAAEDLPKLEQTLNNVCDLLSFATESRVLPYGHEYPAGSGLVSRHSMIGTVQMSPPPFQDSESIKLFVESCYDQFVALRAQRMLHVVIDYLHHSVKRGLAREVQMALTCVIFENLRHNWARLSGYPHIDGFFREKGAIAGQAGNPVGIKRHLKEMTLEVGMNADVERVINVRNEVLHTGLYGDLHIDDTFGFLQTTLREYFLRLVGYHGPFLPYRSGSPVPVVI